MVKRLSSVCPNRLQEEACKTIANMAADPECCTQLGTLGALSLVMLAMRSFPIRDRHEPANGGRPELKGVQGAACGALNKVTHTYSLSLFLLHTHLIMQQNNYFALYLQNSCQFCCLRTVLGLELSLDTILSFF